MELKSAEKVDMKRLFISGDEVQMLYWIIPNSIDHVIVRDMKKHYSYLTESPDYRPGS